MCSISSARGSLFRMLWAIACVVSSLTLTSCQSQKWSFIGISTYTGGDNLDGGKSTATLVLTLNNGQQVQCYLNVPVPQGQTRGTNIPPLLPPIPQLGWGSNTTYNNDTTAPSGCNFTTPIDGTLFAGGSVVVSLYEKSCDTFCDNWDLEGLSVTLYASPNGNPSGGTTCLLKAGYWGPGDHGDNPAIARLKGGEGQETFYSIATTPSYKIPAGCGSS